VDRSFAGILEIEPGGGRSQDRARVRELLREEPAVDDFALGPLTLGFSGGPAGRSGSGVLCLLDGHIHELESLRCELELPGAGPESILATAYARWGEELLERLRGSFVVVFWDPAAGRGIVARDQLGARSIFLHRSGRRLLLASELRDLLRLVPSRPGPDRLSVLDWLARAKVPAGRTLYEGIYPLRPGHFLRLEERSGEGHRYWALRYLPRRSLSRSEAAEGLRSELQRAAGRHIAGEGTTGLMLSGGIDSSTIAAAALPVCQSRGISLRTYSGVFPDEDSVDESALIDTVTRALGLDGVRMAPRGGSALAGALDFLERWEMPLVSAQHFIWRPLLRRASEDGATVMLRGELGDELFANSVYLLADRIARGRLLSAWRLARRCPGGREASVRRIARHVRRFGLRGAVPRPVHEAVRRARGAERYVPSLFSEASARLYLEHGDEWLWKDGAGPRWWADQVDLVTRNPEEFGVLEFLRRQDSEAGLRSGQPLIDVELIEFVLSLPPEYAFDPDYNRPLLRESLRGLVPDEVRLRTQKSHFNAIANQAISGPDLEPARELLGSPSAEINAYLRPGRVRDQLLNGPDRHPGGQNVWRAQLWRLLTAETWLRFQSDRMLPQRVSSQWSLPQPACDFRDVEHGGIVLSSS
jgi:asparagine synthase (glutamine-hydrolysing)